MLITPNKRAQCKLSKTFYSQAALLRQWFAQEEALEKRLEMRWAKQIKKHRATQYKKFLLKENIA